MRHCANFIFLFFDFCFDFFVLKYLLLSARCYNKDKSIIRHRSEKERRDSVGKKQDKLLDTVTFGPQLVAVDISSNNSECAIFQTAQLLLNAGCVEQSYPDAVWKREQSFPTGLQLKDTCVAIPHAEAVYVKESAIALGILRNPVNFQMMGEPDQSGPVRLLVMLAIKDPNKQIDVLQNLMEVFQTEGAVQSILQAETCEQAADCFATLIQKGGK